MAAAPNLIQRHQTWYVVVAVPRRLWRPGVKRQVVRTLGTRDKAEAMRKRFATIADILANIEHLSGAKPATPAGPVEAKALPADHLKSALGWRKTWPEIEAGNVEGLDDGRPAGADPIEWAKGVASAEIRDTAWDIRWEHGEAAARAYVGIAKGTATPLLIYVDAWLAEGGRKGPLSVKTAAGYRADMRGLERWLAVQGVTTLEQVTKAVAGRWVSETMIAAGVPWATANKRITAPASYWKWLIKRGHAEVTPWAGQSVAKQARRKGAPGEKRPFTDAEMTALLAGKADTEMSDAIRLAALSGMRLEELYSLTVADCAGGWFDIRQSKTEAGIRRVPIHSALASIVARRIEGKASTAFLMHEASPPKGRGRSVYISKRFGRYRQSVDVHEKAENKRSSAVDFHSFRRRFVTVARNAGIDRAVVAAVVGHTAQDVTDGIYLGSFNDARLRECVEAVSLPASCSTA